MKTLNGRMPPNLKLTNEHGNVADISHNEQVTPPEGYNKIEVHLIFDVAHDGRHMSRCMSDKHLTDIPIDSVYYGVVSLRLLNLMLFLAKLDDLKTWATDKAKKMFISLQALNRANSFTNMSRCS